MDKLISIIIPVYNAEKYIRRCIESVINQTYKNLEIILINDGSTDNSQQICEEYKEKDDRIVLLGHDYNKGVSSARNYGIDVCRGDYIGFVDADDRIEPNMYECLLENLLIYDSDISVCGYIKETPVGVLLKEELCGAGIQLINGNDCIYSLFYENAIGGYLWAKLFKRSAIGDLRLNIDIRRCEDFLLMYHILKNIKSVVIVNEALYYYNIHEDSCTGKKEFTENQFDALFVYQEIAEAEKTNPEIRAVCEKKYVLYALGVLKYIVANKVYPEKYNQLKNDIRSYEKEILSHTEISVRVKTEVILLKWFSLFKMVYSLRKRDW